MGSLLKPRLATLLPKTISYYLYTKIAFARQ